MTKENQAIQNIIEALTLVCPIEEINDYHKASIEKLVSHFKKYGESKSPAFFLSFTESIQVDELNNVVEHIKVDIVSKVVNYLWREDEDKDEYQKAVFNVIRLIQHRVHCILD